jgi:hypothetical protein
VERVFSKVIFCYLIFGTVCLHSLFVHLHMCLGNWSMLGYVRDKDVLAVTVLPDVDRDEEEELPDGWDTI